jgi:7tm Chemosensory receptor
MHLAGSSFVLQPVLLFSKYTGTLPFGFKADDNGHYLIFVNGFTWFVCFLYTVCAYVRDFKYIISEVVLRIAFPEKLISAAEILYMCHDTLFHAFLFTVFITSFLKYSDFIKLFQNFAQLEKTLKLENPRKIRNIFLFLLIAINFLDLSQQVYVQFINAREYSFASHNVFRRILAAIVRCNQNSIDFEFGCISFIVYKFFQQINKTILTTSTKMSVGEANRLRKCFGHLHAMTEVLNHIYGPCILFSLSVKGVALQNELYHALIKVYSYLVSSNEMSLSFAFNYLRWFLINTYRVIIIVWLSRSISEEVKKLTLQYSTLNVTKVKM